MLNYREIISSLRKDERGQVAIMFGLTIIPAILFIGGGIDFSNAYRDKQKLQSAADAAVLAAVGMPYGTSSTARQSMATAVFNANVSGITVTPTIQGERQHRDQSALLTLTRLHS